MDITMTTYERNVVPYCFLCGWYVGDSNDDRYISQPYIANRIAYGIEAREEDYGVFPPGVSHVLPSVRASLAMMDLYAYYGRPH